MTWKPTGETEAERELERRRTETQRTRQADWSSDVAVPAGQSLLIAAGVAVGVLVTAGSLAVWQEWRFWLPLAAASVLGGLTFALSAILLTLDHRRLLWAAERALDVDLDRDSVVGEPEREIERRLIYVRDPARRKRLERARDFRFFLKQAYNGRGTTWRNWKDQKLPSGEGMSRPRWEQYTERLLQAGLAERPYETAPLELSSDLRDALDAFRELL